ncbi:MAG TPA: dihydrofolate reductase family protein [Anaerolineales bacterium]|nr:dihydrofolate reductase family protein [Anaerolineales bacterium]
MRKAIMFNLITLDGLFEGVNKWDIGWHRVDQEFNEFAINQLHQAAGLIFGRVTYQGMAAYWQSPDAIHNDPVVAGLMNAIPKFVFTNTLEKAEWNNTQLIKGDAVEGLKILKAQPGNDLYIFGSANLASTFTRDGLIDEYRLILNPVVLGKGNPVFQAHSGMLKFSLVDLKTFHNGNVLLYYRPDGR